MSSKDKEKPVYIHLEQNLYRNGLQHQRFSEDISSPCNCNPDVGCDDNCQNRSLYVECDPATCPCTRYDEIGNMIPCANTVIGCSRYPATKVFKTPKSGFGLKLATDVGEDEIICEYRGEVLTMEQSFQRMAKYKASDGFYFAALGNDLVLDASKMGSEARFANHSCDPNSYLQRWTVAGEWRLVLTANEPLKSGTEVTYSYNFNDDNFENNPIKQQTCHCGSPFCTGTVGGTSYMRHDINDAFHALRRVMEGQQVLKRVQMQQLQEQYQTLLSASSLVRTQMRKFERYLRDVDDWINEARDLLNLRQLPKVLLQHRRQRQQSQSAITAMNGPDVNTSKETNKKSSKKRPKTAQFSLDSDTKTFGGGICSVSVSEEEASLFLSSMPPGIKCEEEKILRQRLKDSSLLAKDLQRHYDAVKDRLPAPVRGKMNVKPEHLSSLWIPPSANSSEEGVQKSQHSPQSSLIDTLLTWNTLYGFLRRLYEVLPMRCGSQKTEGVQAESDENSGGNLNPGDDRGAMGTNGVKVIDNVALHLFLLLDMVDYWTQQRFPRTCLPPLLVQRALLRFHTIIAPPVPQSAASLSQGLLRCQLWRHYCAESVSNSGDSGLYVDWITNDVDSIFSSFSSSNARILRGWTNLIEEHFHEILSQDLLRRNAIFSMEQDIVSDSKKNKATSGSKYSKSKDGTKGTKSVFCFCCLPEAALVLSTAADSSIQFRNDCNSTTLEFVTEDRACNVQLSPSTEDNTIEQILQLITSTTASTYATRSRMKALASAQYAALLDKVHQQVAQTSTMVQCTQCRSWVHPMCCGRALRPQGSALKDKGVHTDSTNLVEEDHLPKRRRTSVHSNQHVSKIDKDANVESNTEGEKIEDEEDNLACEDWRCVRCEFLCPERLPEYALAPQTLWDAAVLSCAIPAGKELTVDRKDDALFVSTEDDASYTVHPWLTSRHLQQVCVDVETCAVNHNDNQDFLSQAIIPQILSASPLITLTRLLRDNVADWHARSAKFLQVTVGRAGVHGKGGRSNESSATVQPLIQLLRSYFESSKDNNIIASSILKAQQQMQKRNKQRGRKSASTVTTGRDHHTQEADDPAFIEVITSLQTALQLYSEPYLFHYLDNTNPGTSSAVQTSAPSVLWRLRALLWALAARPVWEAIYRQHRLPRLLPYLPSQVSLRQRDQQRSINTSQSEGPIDIEATWRSSNDMLMDIEPDAAVVMDSLDTNDLRMQFFLSDLRRVLDGGSALFAKSAADRIYSSCSIYDTVFILFRDLQYLLQCGEEIGHCMASITKPSQAVSLVRAVNDAFVIKQEKDVKMENGSELRQIRDTSNENICTSWSARLSTLYPTTGCDPSSIPSASTCDVSMTTAGRFWKLADFFAWDTTPPPSSTSSASASSPSESFYYAQLRSLLLLSVITSHPELSSSFDNSMLVDEDKFLVEQQRQARRLLRHLQYPQSLSIESDSEEAEGQYVYCYCGGDEDGSTMVQCDREHQGCGVWFHAPCVRYCPVVVGPEKDAVDRAAKRQEKTANKGGRRKGKSRRGRRPTKGNSMSEGDVAVGEACAQDELAGQEGESGCMPMDTGIAQSEARSGTGGGEVKEEAVDYFLCPACSLVRRGYPYSPYW